MVFKLSGLKATSLVLEINEDQKSFCLSVSIEWIRNFKIFTNSLKNNKPMANQ